MNPRTLPLAFMLITRVRKEIAAINPIKTSTHLDSPGMVTRAHKLPIRSQLAAVRDMVKPPHASDLSPCCSRVKGHVC